MGINKKLVLGSAFLLCLISSFSLYASKPQSPLILSLSKSHINATQVEVTMMLSSLIDFDVVELVAKISDGVVISSGELSWRGAIAKQIPITWQLVLQAPAELEQAIELEVTAIGRSGNGSATFVDVKRLNLQGTNSTQTFMTGVQMKRSTEFRLDK